MKNAFEQEHTETTEFSLSFLRSFLLQNSPSASICVICGQNAFSPWLSRVQARKAEWELMKKKKETAGYKTAAS
jgi:hypothetical protein